MVVPDGLRIQAILRVRLYIRFPGVVFLQLHSRICGDLVLLWICVRFFFTEIDLKEERNSKDD